MPASLEFPMKGTVPIKKGGCESILFLFLLLPFFSINFADIILSDPSEPPTRLFHSSKNH